MSAITARTCCCGGIHPGSCPYCSPLILPIELPSVGRPIDEGGTIDGIYPCWFNGIVQPLSLGMSCKIKVTKVSTGAVLCNINHGGVGTNQRARPECCPSYFCFEGGVGYPCPGFCPDASPVPKMPDGPFPYGNTMTGNLGGNCNGVPAVFTSYTNINQTDDWCDYMGNGSGIYSWLCAEYRYTTPQFTVIDAGTNESRNISLHVLVPHTSNSAYGSPFEYKAGYCTTSLQFSYGMDITAPNEIAALEAAGFTWSTLPESDGVWLARNKYGELRVLHNFTKTDIDYGGVMRTFVDWHGGKFHKTVTRNGFQIEIQTGLQEYKCASAPSSDCPDCRISFPERLPGRLQLVVDLPAGSQTDIGGGKRCYEMGDLRIKLLTGQEQWLAEDGAYTRDVSCAENAPKQPQQENGVGNVRYRQAYACPQDASGSFGFALLKMDYASTAGASQACADACDLSAGCYPNGEPNNPYVSNGSMDGPMYIDCDVIRFDAFADQLLNPSPPSCLLPCTDGAVGYFDRFYVAWRASKAANGGDMCDPRGSYGYPFIWGKSSTGGNVDWTRLPEDWKATVTVSGV